MKNSKNGVLICGAYGMDNAGDDAVLRSLVSALRDFDSERPLWVMARKPGRTAKKFGVGAVHPLNIPRWLALMGRSKLFISGGGSLLQNATSDRSLWYYLQTLRLAKKRGCKTLLYGCGLGPVTGEKHIERCRETLETAADAILLRDEQSAETLQSWGVTKPGRVTADPAFRLKAPAGEREKAMGFALRPWPGWEKQLPALEAAARHAWERYNLRPCFVALAPEDLRPARELMARLPELPCRIVNEPRRLGNMTMVLSMRLHGLIFALQGGASPAGLSYDPKVTAFCRENGLPCRSFETVTSAELCDLIDRAAALDPERLAETAERARQKEKQNAEILWELLAESDRG